MTSYCNFSPSIPHVDWIEQRLLPGTVLPANRSLFRATTDLCYGVVPRLLSCSAFSIRTGRHSAPVSADAPPALSSWRCQARMHPFSEARRSLPTRSPVRLAFGASDFIQIVIHHWMPSPCLRFRALAVWAFVATGALSRFIGLLRVAH